MYDIILLLFIYNIKKEICTPVIFEIILQVVFRATRGRDGQGDIAVDDIEIKEGKCNTGNLIKIIPNNTKSLKLSIWVWCIAHETFQRSVRIFTACITDLDMYFLGMFHVLSC